MTEYDYEKIVKECIKILQNIRTERRKYFQQPNMMKAELREVGKLLLKVTEPDVKKER